MNRTVVILVLTVTMAAVAVGCDLFDSPEGAARAWLTAVMNRDGNRMAELTCAEEQEAMQQAGLWISAFDILGQAVIGQRTQADVSGLRFTIISQSGDTACVRVTGEVRQAILAFSQTQTMDDRMGMIREDGRWKYCGECY